MSRRCRSLIWVVAALTLLVSACGASTGNAEFDGAATTSSTIEAAAPTTETRAEVTEPVLDPGVTRTRPPIVETIPSHDTRRPPPGDPVAFNQRLARTLNLGGILELDREEPPWGPELSPASIDDIAAQGFTAVRLPVNFATWSGPAEGGFIIDEAIFARVDEVLAAAEANDLAVIIDLHQFEAINEDPAGSTARFLAIWQQVALRYRDRAVTDVGYEVLNEPNTNLTSELWNPLLVQAVDTIRAIDPSRTLIVGPTDWNDPLALPNFELPADDNLILTIHYYAPFEFTHQGAEWLPFMAEFLGTDWDAATPVPGSNETEGERIDREFAEAATWARERDVPVFLGEFGVLDTADEASRIKWVRWVREAADNEGFAWGYWDWAAPGFGLFDQDSGVWNTDLLEALDR